ncbi:glycine betaine ABC transporter substrate-binding protein [Modestobacter sp. NPDC013298]
MRARLFTPLVLAAALATAACGESGSSGTGGDSAAGGSGSGSSAGATCAPVKGDQLVVLQDDKNLQNADNVLPAVNGAAASGNPALISTLDKVSAVLTTDDLVQMNADVDVQRKNAADVAADYVKSKKLDSGQSGGSGKVVVGGSNFTESTVLANVFADTLKAAGFDASVQTVGNRELYLQALESGEIQVVPEYLSTLTEFLDGDDNRQVASGDVDKTFAALTPLAQSKGLAVGTPSKAADQNAFAVTKAFADKVGVTTLSELGQKCSDGSLVLAGPTECPTRPFCQPGLEQTYGLEFASFSSTDAGGPLTKAALQQGKASIGLVFSSDGALAKQ